MEADCFRYFCKYIFVSPLSGYNFIEVIITSMLDEYEIPFIVKDDEAGSIMRIIGGSSIYGATIYVPDFIYEKSRNIVADTFEGIEFDNYEPEKEI